MRLTVLKSKVHRLTVTDANLDYEGSFTLDEELMDAAGFVRWERIDVLNVTNGSRLTTYVIPGPRGSRVGCANGAAAHHVRRGDVVILASYAEIEAADAVGHDPIVVHVDEHNEIRARDELAAASSRHSPER